MGIIKITYERVFPLAPYVNEKIGVEVDVRPGDNTDREFEYAKSIVERWHKEGNPSLYVNLIQSPSEIPVIYKDEIISDSTIIGISIGDILSCNSLVVLDAYKGLIKDNDTLMPAYEKRRTELLGDGIGSL
jgi:hypothetical protein